MRAKERFLYPYKWCFILLPNRREISLFVVIVHLVLVTTIFIGKIELITSSIGLEKLHDFIFKKYLIWSIILKVIASRTLNFNHFASREHWDRIRMHSLVWSNIRTRVGNYIFELNWPNWMIFFSSCNFLEAYMSEGIWFDLSN